MQDRGCLRGAEVVEAPDDRLAAVQVLACIHLDVDAAEIVLVRVPRLVAGGRIVRHASAGDDVDRLRDHPVGEERLGEIAHVVDDHVGAGIGQLDDALCEIELAVERRVERDAGPGRHVVHQLGHGAAFVGGAGAIPVVEDRGIRRQVAVADVLGERGGRRSGLERAGVAAHGVRQRSHLHAAAVDSMRRTRVVRVERHVALRNDRPRRRIERCEHGPRRSQRRQRRDVTERPDRHPRGDQRAAGRDLRGAEVTQRLRERRRIRGVEVDADRAVRHAKRGILRLEIPDRDAPAGGLAILFVKIAQPRPDPCIWPALDRIQDCVGIVRRWGGESGRRCRNHANDHRRCRADGGGSNSPIHCLLLA